MSSDLEVMVEAFATVLKAEGFKWSGQGFVRLRDEFVDCIALQLKSDRTAYSVNLGIQPIFMIEPGEQTVASLGTVQEVDCYIRERLVADDETDHWWPLAGNPSVIAQEFAAMYEQKGRPFFDFFTSVASSILPLSVERIMAGDYSLYFSKLTRTRLSLLAAKANLHAHHVENAKALAAYGLSIAGMAVGPKKEFRRILEQV